LGDGRSRRGLRRKSLVREKARARVKARARAERKVLTGMVGTKRVQAKHTELDYLRKFQRTRVPVFGVPGQNG